MKLYGYSPAFSGQVPEDKIQRNDSDYPQFMFLMDHEESLDFVICGWTTVIFVRSLSEARGLADRLESMYESPSGNVSS
jgi:hypothetical protein